MDDIIPSVTAEPAPIFTDADLLNTNPHFILQSGTQATLMHDHAMPMDAERDVDGFLHNTHSDVTGDSALRGTTDAILREEWRW